MVNVSTVNEPGAGTTATVSITLFGSKGESGARILNEDPDNFSTGGDDIFAIEAVPVGEVQRVRLEHDSAGADSAWKVGSVSVRDTVSNRTRYFHCNSWLASDRGSFETTIELVASDSPTAPGAANTGGHGHETEDEDVVEDAEDLEVDVPVEMKRAEAVADDEEEEEGKEGDEGEAAPHWATDEEKETAVLEMQAAVRRKYGARFLAGIYTRGCHWFPRMRPMTFLSGVHSSYRLAL
jgi:hypothetical protein